jgi:hypothetical protein
MKWVVALGFICNVGFGWTHVGLNIGGWTTSTITFDFNPTGCTVSTSTLNAIIDEAIEVWNSVPTSGVRLARNTTASSMTRTNFDNGTLTTPLIVCEANFSGNTGADPDFVPAATQVSTNSTGFLDSALLALNGEGGTSAEISQLTDDLLLVIMAHEIGHVLGLGHSSESDALMYFSVANKTDPVLSVDDMDGLSQLYPRNEFGPGAYGCAAVHGARSAKSLWWLVACMGMTLGLGRLFRPGRLRELPVPPLSNGSRHPF